MILRNDFLKLSRERTRKNTKTYKKFVFFRVHSRLISKLCLFEIGEFFDQLFLSEARETDR